MRNRISFCGWCAWLFCLALPYALGQDAGPRTRGHAHNDYLHERPLLDALDAGFYSVEADVFLVDGQLLVAHRAAELDPQRTLQKLYLDPLRERIVANAGQVYRGSPGHTALEKRDKFWLLIDIKSAGLETYQSLHAVLQQYAELLTSVEAGVVKSGPVQVVISGNRPVEFIAAQTQRFCGLDGRLGDLESTHSAHLMPMTSDNWGLNFAWRGSGDMPEEELQKLKHIVRQSHERGRVVRFWATPENEKLWRVLWENQVDWINTDQLPELSDFLRAQAAAANLTKVPVLDVGHPAFVISAPQPAHGNPWVWYAPTLGDHLPGEGHRWYFERFLDAGISIAGVDLGEVRGSPKSNSQFLAFHAEMVRRGYSSQPVLLGQSRGGLMMLSFAASYPDKLSGWAGIYPVCNLTSWPLKNSKSATLADYAMTESELLERLPELNPVDRLEGLLRQRVPLFAVHGDQDGVVPLEENSGLVQRRYTAAGGRFELKTIAGEGHKVSSSFFECQELVDFVTSLALQPTATRPPQ
jgi:pimeloyl-ACP methyl ester carboxylesterase